jgi:hypothetical protein
VIRSSDAGTVRLSSGKQETDAVSDSPFFSKQVAEICNLLDVGVVLEVELAGHPQ